MQKVLAYLGIALVLVLGFFAGYCFRGLRPGPVPPEPQRDTTWIHDTIRLIRPVPVVEREIDTLLLEVPVHQTDTLLVPVPITQKYYHDENYDLWISGFRPNLDSIYVFKETAVVEIPVIKTVTKRWGIGVQGGVTYLPKTGITPYVGVGVSYNLLTF